MSVAGSRNESSESIPDPLNYALEDSFLSVFEHHVTNWRFKVRPHTIDVLGSNDYFTVSSHYQDDIDKKEREIAEMMDFTLEEWEQRIAITQNIGSVSSQDYAPVGSTVFHRRFDEANNWQVPSALSSVKSGLLHDLKKYEDTHFINPAPSSLPPIQGWTTPEKYRERCIEGSRVILIELKRQLAIAEEDVKRENVLLDAIRDEHIRLKAEVDAT